MNWKLWLEGLGAAALGGATTGVTQVLASGGGLTKGTGIAAIIGAIFGVGAYLKPPATGGGNPPSGPTPPGAALAH